MLPCGLLLASSTMAHPIFSHRGVLFPRCSEICFPNRCWRHAHQRRKVSGVLPVIRMPKHQRVESIGHFRRQLGFWKGPRFAQRCSVFRLCIRTTLRLPSKMLCAPLVGSLVFGCPGSSQFFSCAASGVLPPPKVHQGDLPALPASQRAGLHPGSVCSLSNG